MPTEEVLIRAEFAATRTATFRQAVAAGLYEAYREQTGSRVPPWTQLPRATQQAWEASAKWAIEHFAPSDQVSQ